jgi:excisionase family DNA binding protein
VREHPRKDYGLLTPEQAAEWLGISRAFFFKLVKEKPLRRVELTANTIRYDVRDLRAWADANGNVEPMGRAG